MTTAGKTVLFTLVAVALCVWMNGCGFGGPKVRWGYTPKGSFGNADDLGKHAYGFGGSEAVGIFYTRAAVPSIWTTSAARRPEPRAYLKAYAAIMAKDDMFTSAPPSR